MANVLLNELMDGPLDLDMSGSEERKMEIPWGTFNKVHMKMKSLSLLKLTSYKKAIFLFF